MALGKLLNLSVPQFPHLKNGDNNTIELIGLYEFPRAAMTNCYKLGGLRQQKYIGLQFWGWKAKFKELAGPCSLQRLMGRISAGLPHLLVAPEFHGVWLRHSSLCLCFPMASSSLFTSSVSYEDICYWM